MDYTLNQLQIFLKVVEKESVTKASTELHLTQPAVSIQLKNFQNQFDIPLTEVIGRRIYITDFGREVAESAKEIINQVYAINYKTMAYKGQLTGKLKLSIVSTGKYVMPYFISDFISKNSGVELQMDVTNKNAVIQSLGKNEVDFALVFILPEAMAVEYIDLMPNKLYLVGNASAEFDQAKNTKKLFQNIPLIFRETGSGTRQTMSRFIENNEITVQKKLELTSNEAVKQAILAGLGCSIMPLIGIKNELRNKELKIIPVKGLPIKTTWRLIWLKGKKHAPVPSALLAYLNKEKEHIIQNKFDWYEQYTV